MGGWRLGGFADDVYVQSINQLCMDYKYSIIGAGDTNNKVYSGHFLPSNVFL